MMASVLMGTLIGATAALLWLYGLRPDIPYPRWMLQSFHHPWIFLVMLILVMYVATFSPVLAVMLFLLVAALLMDMILYATPVAPGYVRTQTVLPTPRGVYGASPAAEQNPKDGVPTPYEARASHGTGISLSGVPLPEPAYPVFHAHAPVQPGDPAPFAL